MTYKEAIAILEKVFNEFPQLCSVEKVAAPANEPREYVLKVLTKTSSF
ncbi:hypothetical protein LCGC14_2450730 [marine sediment metagenome]|uniref:Uncharacterized protein n=1 Tax=marine sediment metagenome TaxID=412755 RepID=A0A0F9BG90_9ZZZZ